MTPLDKRLHAYRDDLADEGLKGRCDSKQFTKPVIARCVTPVAGLHRAPADDAMQLTQVLYGETVLVFERKNHWAWVQLDRDGYVGYVQESALGDHNGATTHHVVIRSAHLYPQPDLKTQPAVAVPMNAELVVGEKSGDYFALSTGQFIFADHINTAPPIDFVSVAEQFLHTPYLWGGKTVGGIDCSGLVQLALHACGISALRDSDMQEQSLGKSIPHTDLKRGDLVFWKGHVGIMKDAGTLLHANGHHMKVVSEPLSLAIERIAAKGSRVTSIKRL